VGTSDGLERPSYGIGVIAALMGLVRMGWTRVLHSAAVRPACPEAVDAADWSDIQVALDGDSDAYSRLVRRYQQPIGSYMWRFTRDRGQWEELVQDVFVEAYLTLASYRGRAPLLHWLRRIATRVGYRWWRERARRRAQSPATVRDWDQLPDDPPAASPSEAAQLVHKILDQASARDRLVLTLLYLEECSVQEISQLTGWSVAMVKVQAFRARKRLGKILEQVQ
jgi:RNA polymerase sigma-70 factor (ECF subfamily)